MVAKHEITHRLQEIAPEAYRTYRDYAVNAMAERDGSTATLVERYKARYAQSGVNLTTEQAMDEIAADFTEALTVDPSRFDHPGPGAPERGPPGAGCPAGLHLQSQGAV